MEVEPDAAGVHDELLLSLARELLANAARHAEASRVDVAVRREPGEVVLSVADDGAGFAPGRLEAALADGRHRAGVVPRARRGARREPVRAGRRRAPEPASRRGFRWSRVRRRATGRNLPS